MFGCAGAVKGGRPSPEPSFTSLQQTLTARPWSAHQAREQSLSVGECDRGVDIIPLTVWPLTFMLAHKAVPHGCRHLLFTSMCSAIPTSPDSGLTSRCSWTAKANPPSSVDRPACRRKKTLLFCRAVLTSPYSGRRHLFVHLGNYWVPSPYVPS